MSQESNDEHPDATGTGLTVGPDGYLDAVDRQVQLARIMEQPVVVTWWLLAANLLIWLGGVVYGWRHLVETLGITSAQFNYEQLTLYTGMKVNRLMEAGQWWRLFSSQFVHLDIMHMAFNGYGLYVLGPILERFYGRKRFFVLYIFSGTLAGLSSFLINDLPSGGASGAIYGLVGGLLLFGWKYRDSLPERLSRAFTVGLLPWVVFSLGIGFMESIPMDNAAHLGGLASGALIALLLHSRLNGSAPQRREYVVWACALLGACALVYTTAHWSDEITHCTQSAQRYLECYPGLTTALEAP